MKLPFEHIQAAHCENGVTTSLLHTIGIDKITEPLAFGIGSGLFFTYIPLLKVNNGPAFAFISPLQAGIRASTLDVSSHSGRSRAMLTRRRLFALLAIWLCAMMAGLWSFEHEQMIFNLLCTTQQ